MVTTLKDTTVTEGVRYNVCQYKSEFRELHSIISLALLGRRSQIFVDFIFERSYRRCQVRTVEGKKELENK